MQSSRLDRLLSLLGWKTGVVALVGLLLTQVFLANYVIPNVQSRRPEAVKDGMLVMVDYQGLATAAEEYRIFDLYKPDILGYVQLLYAVDFVIALSIAVLFASLIGVMVKYLDRAARGSWPGRWRWLPLMGFCAMPFDFAENALALFLTARNPAQIYYGLATVEGVLTALKELGSGLAMATTVVVLLAVLVRVGQARARPRSA
jgi:hypothetical protein